MSLSPTVSPSYPWPWDPEERGLLLIRLLEECATSVAAGNVNNTDIILERISLLATPDGEPLQRIAAYITESLAVRMLKGWNGLYRALNSTKISSVSEELYIHKLFFEHCPFLKLAYVVTNQAIVEAMEGEQYVHIIDLNPLEPAQWIDLIHTLCARPEGPPTLKITGVHERKEVLEKMAARLKEEAENLNIGVQFVPKVSKLENLDLRTFGVKNGEALAVSSIFQLHTLLATDDETLKTGKPSQARVSDGGHMQRFLKMNLNHGTFGELLEKESLPFYSSSPDSALSPLSLAASPSMNTFLSSLHSLSPKLVVITEQEADHNEDNLMDRVRGALNFYATLFDSLEHTLPRASLERKKLEKMLFGEEIKNIVACEGLERRERHEKLEKWILRLELAGFGKVPLSYHGMLQANRLLRSFGINGYKIREENGGCVKICWQSKPLFSVSAWRYRRPD